MKPQIFMSDAFADWEYIVNLEDHDLNKLSIKEVRQNEMFFLWSPTL